MGDTCKFTHELQRLMTAGPNPATFRFGVEVDQLLEEARSTFPRASDFTTLKPWCGMRPATPRGTPVLGPTPHANLWLDVGHGALGFTLDLASGRMVADLIAGRPSPVPLEGFTYNS